MPVELLNPAGLPAPDFYRQVAVATGTRTVYLAGQVARTAEGEQVGPGDLAAQVEQAFLNVGTALAAVGATFDDVAKLTIYLDPAVDPGAAYAATGAVWGRRRTAVTVLAVAPARAGALVEIEAVASIPAS